MLAVEVDPGLEFEASAPRVLFSGTGLTLQDFYRSYDVHPDGKRFLMLRGGATETGRVNAIFDWRPSSSAKATP